MKHLKVVKHKLENSFLDLYRLSPAWRVIFLSYGVHTILVFSTAAFVTDNAILSPGGFVNPSFTIGQPLLERFLRWDAHWYTYVAQSGYDQQSIVFFPMLILFLRLTAPLLNNDYALAGLLLCNGFAFLSFVLLYHTVRLDFSENIALRSLLAYAVFPTSFFLNSIYTESLFITFSLACIYFWRRKKWLIGGMFAALTTLTRNIGIVIIIFMLFELWRQRHEMLLKPFHAILGLLAAPCTLLAFILYNYQLTGNYFSFIHSQQAWGREFHPPWENLWSCAVKIYNSWPVPEFSLLLDFSLAIFSFFALTKLTYLMRDKSIDSYLFLNWFWFLIPLFSSAAWMPLYSISRFTLVLFPIYLYIAYLPSKLFWHFIFVSALALILSTFQFASWHWIG